MAGYIGKSQGVTLTNVKSDSVEAVDIKDNAVTNRTIASSAVTTDKISNGAVTAEKLDTTYLTDYTVIEADVTQHQAALSITESQISDLGNYATVAYADSSEADAITTANAYTDTAVGNVTTDLVGDTTPQLGGDLTSNGNDILFADNDKAIFGAGSDLQIYHNSSNNKTYIHESGANNLVLKGSSIEITDAAEFPFIFLEDTGSGGTVHLYHDSSEKLATTSTGVSVTGTVSATAFSGDGSGLTGIESFTKSASDPTITTNGTLGDVWVNTTSGEVYVLTDATSNNNIWTNVGEGSGNIKPDVSAELLLIAGGGGGGSGPGEGGGAGAGGLLYYGSETPKTPNGPALSLVRGSTYNVVIGGGGTGATGYTSVTNSNGTNSSFTGVTTAVGGGRGGLYPDAGVGNGGSGGSGGGGGGNALSGGSNTGGSGTNGQGNAGGNGVARGNYGNGLYGAGGGGAGAVGTTPTSSPGNGGIGLQYAIQGTTYYYAGGGAGNTNGTDDGVGGTGGGGNVDTSGNPNSGGGGGAGSSSNGGNGGSGVAILKIPTVDYTGTTSGSPTVTTSGSYTIIKFTSSGSYTA